MVFKEIFKEKFAEIDLKLDFCWCETTENEREFEYEEGPKGPEHWGELKEEWKACGNGTHQSPIDVVKRHARINPDMGKLRRIYRPANATLMNRGHDIMVSNGTFF